MAIQQLPIISYKQLDTKAERERLLWAASEVGFFYLVREHGLSEADLDAVLRVSRSFFALSQAAKEQVSMAYSPHFRGYNAVGQEVTAGAVDMREQFDWMNEEPAPQPLSMTGEGDWAELVVSDIAAVAETTASLSLRQTEIAVTLLRALCQALGVAQDALDDSFRDGPYTHSKIIRYPGTKALQAGRWRA